MPEVVSLRPPNHGLDFTGGFPVKANQAVNMLCPHLQVRGLVAGVVFTHKGEQQTRHFHLWRVRLEEPDVFLLFILYILFILVCVLLLSFCCPFVVLLLFACCVIRAIALIRIPPHDSNNAVFIRFVLLDLLCIFEIFEDSFDLTFGNT